MIPSSDVVRPPGDRAEVAALVRAAREHRPDAERHLVKLLTPIIRARVTRSLKRAGRRFGRVEVEDLTQDIWLVLLESQARVLAAWHPDAGMSLQNFVGLVAERRATSLLRLQRTRFTAEILRSCELLAGLPTAFASPERDASSRELLREVTTRVASTLSSRAKELFERLVIFEELVENTGECQLSRGAAYTWRSRLIRLSRGIAAELEIENTRRIQTGQRYGAGIVNSRSWLHHGQERHHRRSQSPNHR